MKKPAIFIFIILVLSISIFTLFKIYKPPAPLNTEKGAISPTITIWQEHHFEEVKLTFSAPSDMTINGEMIDDTTFTLYVQRSQYPDENYYQLYGLYNLSAQDIDIESLKQEFEEETIEETTVSDVYLAISGMTLGERPRYVTYVITDMGLFTLATAQPTEENIRLTEMILDTMYL